MNNNEISKNDVEKIIDDIILNINPYNKTKECLDSFNYSDGKNILVSIGKASWTMAKAVCDSIRIDEGVVITKYNHSQGPINGIKIYEAGHPIVDQNSIDASEYVLSITSNLKENDNVIMCISGGGSSLFEKPLIDIESLQDINDQLVKSGASISEINVIRKRLSAVKGGKFAKHISPAKIHAIILSDVVGNDVGMIASGPIFNDESNVNDAIEIANKYNIRINDNIKNLLLSKSDIHVDNVDYRIVGSVEQLCEYTKQSLEKYGFKTRIISNDCTDTIEEVANKFKNIINTNSEHNIAYIIGGEVNVSVKANGIGGRNMHLALLVSRHIFKKDNTYFFSFASDGTDGPTDGAGGFVDHYTYGYNDIEKYIENFDSYTFLSKTNGLIKTGPTGCNINDVYVLLIR